MALVSSRLLDDFLGADEDGRWDVEAEPPRDENAVASAAAAAFTDEDAR